MTEVTIIAILVEVLMILHLFICIVAVEANKEIERLNLNRNMSPVVSKKSCM
jgi:hypothetical protein